MRRDAIVRLTNRVAARRGSLTLALMAAIAILLSGGPVVAQWIWRTGPSGECVDPEALARRLLGLRVGETLQGTWVLSRAEVSPGYCGAAVLRFENQVVGMVVEAVARPTEEASRCTCRSRNFCTNLRVAHLGRGDPPSDSMSAGVGADEVPENLARAVCLRAGEHDRGLLLEAGTRNAAYRWFLLALGLLVLVLTFRALVREVLLPETPRYVVPVLGTIVAVAALLRYFLPNWGFVHEYFHFGNTVEAYLHSDHLDTHGEVGPAFYRAVQALFELDEYSIFGTNAVFATLTVAVVALLDYRLFRSWPRALFSAFILAALPHHLWISASEELFVPMVLFAVCGLAAGVHYFDSGNRPSLALSAAGMFLAMQSRPEGALTVVLLGLLALLAVRRRWHRVFFRPATWVAVLALAGAVVLQRTFFASHAERLIGGVDLLRLPWPQVWLDPDVTPFILPALCIVALWHALRSRDLLLLWLFIAAEVTVYSAVVFFAGWTTYALRSQTAALPYFVLLAAGGFESVRRSLSLQPRASAVIASLIGLVMTWEVALRTPFIADDTVDHEVARFLQERIPLLPEGPDVTLLAPATFSPFPREYLWRSRKWIRVVELERWLRGEEPGLTCDNLLVYEAPGCFLASSDRVTDDSMNPQCAAIRRMCRLEPLFTKVLDVPEAYGQARFGDRTDPLLIGFYRAVGPAGDSP